MRRLLAECFGTFALVFAGTGAITINEVSGGVVSHVGISLTFGLVVLSTIYAIGNVSGAHINPAVTLGFWFAGRLERAWVLPYILSQCLGGLLASGILRLLFSNYLTLGVTRPSGSVSQSFVLEIILTWFLMFVILSMSSGSKEKGLMAGAAIGSVIAMEALFAGPISGASMNPARSLAPALVTGQLGDIWIYLTAPVLGALIGVGTCRCVQDKESCGPTRKKIIR